MLTNRPRDALYEDVVNNMALANRYTNYMLNGLGFDPAEFVDPATQPKAAMGGSSYGSLTLVDMR